MTTYDRRPQDRVIEFIKNRLTASDYAALDEVIANSGAGYGTVVSDQRPSTTSPFQKSFDERYPGASKIRIS